MSEAGTESSADQTGGGEEAGLPAPTGPAGSGEWGSGTRQGTYDHNTSCCCSCRPVLDCEFQFPVLS